MNYSELVIEHFASPRNRGHWLAAPDVVSGRAGSPARGVEFALSARIANGVVEAACFQAFGCPHCIASASWLTEQLPGYSHAAVRQWQWRAAARALDVPTEKYGRLLVLEDALRALAADWARRL